MSSRIEWNGRLAIPRALRLGHDEARAELVRASTEGGQVALAAKRLAQICFPHFEREENLVFPALGLLPMLARGAVRPGMAEVLPLLSEFGARQDVLDGQHRSIQSGIDALLQACHREKNREVALLAYSLRVHERIEDEVIFPTAAMIGKYLREHLAN